MRSGLSASTQPSGRLRWRGEVEDQQLQPLVFFCCMVSVMRCLSCQTETPATDLKIFNKILVCPSCHALAEKAELDVERCFERAKQMTKNWLSQHILKGGLLLGGDGRGRERADGADGLREGSQDSPVGHGSSVQHVLHEAAMSSMRAVSRSEDGRQPDVHSGDEAEADVGR